MRACTFVFWILTFVVKSNAQGLDNPIFTIYHPKNKAKFHVVVRHYQPNDEIIALFKRDLVGLGSNVESEYTNSLKFRIRPTNLGSFDFIIPDINHLGTLILVLKRNKKNYQINSRYVVEPGDSVNIEITQQDDTAFSRYSGRGFKKYECSDLVLKDIHDRISLGVSTEVQNKVRQTGKPDVLFFAYPQFLDKYEQLLFQYKSEIEPEVYKFIEVSLKSEIYADLEYFVQYYLTDSLKSSEFKKELRFLYKNNYRPGLDTSNSNLLSLSYSYTRYVLYHTFTSLTDTYDRRPTITEVSRDLIDNYSGMLLDKVLARLLTDLFIRGDHVVFNSAQFDSCLNSALLIVKTSYIKNILADEKVQGKGRMAYEFELPDTANKAVRLSQFSGKVVLMDVWYTGCTGCAVFYEFLKTKIEPEFINDTCFKLISINEDVSQTLWRRSLYKNIYTNLSHINLYTGLYEQSDVLKYYHASGAPFIMVIGKDGRIVGVVHDFAHFSELRPMLLDALRKDR